MLSNELEYCLNDAFHQAREARHEIPDGRAPAARHPRHPKVREVLRACGAGSARSSSRSSRSTSSSPPRARGGRGARGAADAGLPARAAARGVPRAVQRQEGSRRRPTCWSRSSARSRAMRCSCSTASTSRASTWSTTSRTASRRSPRRRPEQGRAGRRGRARCRGRQRALEKYATNLNRMAQDGRIDPLIGRKLEVERTIEILCRRRKNNPLYVGEAGVGKTAHRRGPRAPHRRGQGARGARPTAPSTRSTWAR